MTALTYLGYGVLAVYVLWLFYLGVMNLKRARDAGTLRPVALVLGYPLFAIGIALDAFVNVTVFTVILLELPREWLVTARLERHIEASHGWRRHVAGWFCTNLLDAFDPSGCHCKSDLEPTS